MKTFYHLVVNTVVANITNSTVWFALVFVVYLETRSVTATSITSGLYFAGTALSGIWFGGLVDRYRKKRVMLGSSLAFTLSGLIGLLVTLIAMSTRYYRLLSDRYMADTLSGNEKP